MKPVFLLTALAWQLLASAANTDVINRGNGAEPDSLNPHLAQGLNSMNILLDMYEGLMTFDVNGEPTYGVAISHTVNDDHSQWQFNLNPAAKWSDGRVVTASDFINSWQLAYAPATAAPYRQVMNNLVKNNQLQVSSKNPHHLQLDLNQADSGLLSKLLLPIFLPTRPNNEGQIISNGAYQLIQWRTQERITLEKNPHFHAADDVFTTTVNYWVTENQNSELLRFRAGELDITETIPDNKITWLREHLPDALRIAPYYGTFFLGLNLNDEHLSDPHLRVALSASIDRQILVDKVLKTGQMVAHRIIPTDQSLKGDVAYDLSRAKAALAQSHFKPKTDRLEILYNSSNNQKKVALAVAAMWRQNLGIRSQLKNQEWKVFVNTRKTENKQVFRSGWIADYYDPLNFLELFHSQSNFNFYAFNNKQYDAIIEALRRNNTNKTELINRAEEIIQQEIPVIPLYHYVSRHLVNPQMSGFVDNRMDRHLSRYLSKRQ
ncbi:peptide ABC transporter substrate-binding protein [Marinicella sp. S1101]|uniref:peptide ABC transporter substrate-binding protein n=1 Tax=Marinicella marina TaxID=2996016 RepID=UPI002260F08E|nr:peptide ABC transporter substrate-binding protein [Marinicella marina]MCX7552420.1 peptide ABC transporter substrate-binding protein [Marinicella marina]MDJ1139295.1 peptide ABC transporter substrate-binding protein [Marinicella marina]